MSGSGRLLNILGLGFGLAGAVGGTIGAGILRTPGLVAAQLPSAPLVLAAWLLFTIAAAIAVGWLYGGKAWCQYFCPMAPVQSIYSTPAGLLGSKAHLSPTPITQSMCRTITADGREQSACVACHTHDTSPDFRWEARWPEIAHGLGG